MELIKQQEVLGKDFKVYGTWEQPLFLAKDVAEWIDYDKSNISKMVKLADADEKVRTNSTTPGGEQELWFLTEDGVYEVLMQSRKPIAKAFKKEVKAILKDIRKHGVHATSTKMEDILNDPDSFIALLQNLKAERSKNQELQVVNSTLSVKNTIMQPKSDYFDELVDRNLLTSFRETAKELDVKEKMFISFLLEKKYLYRDQKGKLTPYAGKGAELFSTKECFNEKTKWSGTQTLITPKGRETFRLLMKGV